MTRVRKIETLEENYLNKQEKCYCWIDDEEPCYNKNSCIKCSLDYAKYILETKERGKTDVRVSVDKNLKKTDKDIGSICFECEYFIAGKKNWANKCYKYNDFCKNVIAYCNKN